MEKLEAAIVQSLQSPAVRQRLDSTGFVLPPLGSAEYTKFVANEHDRWVKVIKTAGIKEE